ncbi:hypothetical protein KM043_002089 [Ampulex compressa]|nr:hypothetical protein KM043_002089 [Ampulex compressa]
MESYLQLRRVWVTMNFRAVEDSQIETAVVFLWGSPSLIDALELDSVFRRRQRFLIASSISSRVTYLFPAIVANLLPSSRHSSRMPPKIAAETPSALRDITYFLPVPREEDDEMRIMTITIARGAKQASARIR